MEVKLIECSLTLSLIKLGITCPRIGSMPSSLKGMPVNTQLFPSQCNAYTAIGPQQMVDVSHVMMHKNF